MVDVDELLSRLGVIQDTCCTDTKELSQTQLQLLAASESNAVLHQQLAASTQALTHLQALGDAHLDSTQELASLAAAPDHRREESSWRMSMTLVREELESAKRERDNALSLVQQQQQQHNDAGNRARGAAALGPRLPTPGYYRRS
ncbi:MAG: hypothetical protein WDW38_005368 [Sanguina aurantia]